MGKSRALPETIIIHGESSVETVEVFVDKELNISVFRFRGLLAYKDIHHHMSQYHKDYPTKYAIWDFSETDPSKLEISEIKKLAQYAVAAKDIRKGGAAALVVPKPFQYGLARMFLAYAEITHKHEHALKIMVFRSEQDAFSWIRSLEAKKAG